MTESPLNKPPLRQRLKDLTVEYGSFALWVYFGIFTVVLLGFALTIQLGFHSASAAGRASVWGAAYVVTKLTQPLRIFATLALTPVLMRLLRRKRPSTEKA